MSTRKPINYSKTKQSKKRYKLKKEFIIFVSVISIMGGTASVKAITNTLIEKKEEKIKLELIKKEKEEKQNQINKLKSQFPSINENGLNDVYDSSIIWERLKKYDYSKLDGEKVIFLTYDDGPSTTNTPVILDTLKKHDVKATFFVTGKTIENGGDTAKKILLDSYNYGNSIANHSYSHDYKKLYPNGITDTNAFLEDFNKSEEILSSVLGKDFKTKVWRCPGGLMSWKNTQEIQQYAIEHNIGIIDWNALNKDSEGKKKNADELYEEAVKSSEGKDMIVLLMHDTYGKEETAKYTDRIIQYYKDNGYVFKTLA